MAQKKDRVPRRDGDHVNYEGGARKEAPVDPADLPQKRSERVPPQESRADDKGGGEVEAQEPPFHTPAANEAVEEDGRGKSTRRSHRGD